MHCNFAFFYSEGAAFVSAFGAERLSRLQKALMVLRFPMPPNVFGPLHRVAETTECSLSSSCDAWHRSPARCPSTVSSNDDVSDRPAPMAFPQRHLQRLP